MRLRDEGRLELDDRDRRAPPRDRGHRRSARVTIAQLLSHTSGLQAETVGPVVGAGRRAAAGPTCWPAARRCGSVPARGSTTPTSGMPCWASSWAGCAACRGTRPSARTCSHPLGMSRTTTAPGGAGGAGLGRAPAGRPAARRARARRRGDGAGRAALVDGARTSRRWAAFLGRRHGRPARHGHPRGDVPAASRSTTCPARRGPAAHGLGWQVWNVDGRPVRRARRLDARLPRRAAGRPGHRRRLRRLRERDLGHGTARHRPAATCSAERSRVPCSPGTPDADQATALELVGDWYWGTTAYDLRLAADGHLVLGEPGQHRGSRFRPTETGWVGLDGYYEGEPLVVVRDADGASATSTWARSGSAARPTTPPPTSPATSTPTAGTDPSPISGEPPTPDFRGIYTPRSIHTSPGDLDRCVVVSPFSR